jgi:O-antigen ligase
LRLSEESCEIVSSPAALSERPPQTETHASPPERGARLDGLRLDSVLWPALAIAAILCWITFHAGGGLNLESMTGVELGLTIGSGLIIALAILLAPVGRRAYGLGSTTLLLALTAVTALSVVWSVQPDDSWQDAGRMLAYSGVFAAAVALAHAAPNRWPAVLGGVVLAAVVVCGYALATEVFPARLDPNDLYARLQEPYGYWNAIGLTAAMGAIGALWLGARRAGHELLSALSYPIMGLFLTTLMLAYSRGALAALALGMVLWFCVVPLRLRSAAVLIAGGAGAAIVVAWDFSQHALSSDGVLLADRVNAGHQLGVLLAAVLIALSVVGLCVGFFTARRAPRRSTRRRAGTMLITLLVLGILAFAGRLALSHRGLFGSISHTFNSLTNPNAPVPANTPGRLTAVGSVRARYWNEALDVYKAHPLLGSGARGFETAHLRYRTELIEAHQAHGYVVQTLADLGLVGLAITLALLLAWMCAAGRSTHPFNRRFEALRWRKHPTPYTAERIGMLGMLCLVVVFGLHSLIDWTWYVPGDACVALICAGWLAGRGALAGGAHAEEHTLVVPSSEMWMAGLPDGRGRRPRVPSLSEVGSRRILIASCVLVVTFLAVWAQIQPQRSADASNEALALLARNPTAALAAANRAVSRDPLSAEALFTLATVQQDSGQSSQAHMTLQRAVRLQPSNPQTWLTLARYDMSTDPTAALGEFRAAIYLNPESIAPQLIAQNNEEAVRIQNDFVLVLRRAQSLETHARKPPARSGQTKAPARKAGNTGASAAKKRSILRRIRALRKSPQPSH